MIRQLSTESHVGRESETATMRAAPFTAASLQIGDRLILAAPITPGVGNSLPRHLLGSEPITHYTVMRILPPAAPRPGRFPHPDDAHWKVHLDDGRPLGVSTWTFEQVDARINVGEWILPEGRAA